LRFNKDQGATAALDSESFPREMAAARGDAVAFAQQKMQISAKNNKR